MRTEVGNLGGRIRQLLSPAPSATRSASDPGRGRVVPESSTQRLLREVAMLNDRVQVLTSRLETEREERAVLRGEHAALQLEHAALRARAETLGEVIAALHANLEDLRLFRDEAAASSRSAWSRLAPIRGSRPLHE